jgi:hypothetical protein
MFEDKIQERPRQPARSGEEISEAVIDQNLQESFPASDPPSWTLGTDQHRTSPTSTEEPAAKEES